MRLKHAFCGLALVAGTLWAAPAFADDPVSLGAFDDWEAFTYQANGAPVCYVFSTPKKTESDKKIAKRDPVYFLVTDFSGRKIKGQVSTIIGYPFKESSIVDVKVDDLAFQLYSSGDTAWAASNDIEAQIVKALKTGKALTVTGTSWKGTQTTDSYSLTGVAKALEKIDATCK
jgi:hypothetical protein